MDLERNELDNTEVTPDAGQNRLDLAIIERLHSGEDINYVISQLYQRHGNRVLAYLVSRSGNQNDAEDFAQQTWIKVARALPEFTGKHFTSWLITIAKNTMISEFRKRAVRTTVNGDWVESIADVPEIDQANDSLERFRICLKKLKTEKPEFYTVVKLRLTGRKHDEIATELNIPAKTSMSRFDRSKGRLKICLEAEQ